MTTRNVYKTNLSNAGFYFGAAGAISEILCDFGERFPSEMLGSPDGVYGNVYGTEIVVNSIHPKFGHVVEIYDLYDDKGEFCCFIPADNFKVVVESIYRNKQPPKLVRLEYDACDRTRYLESMERE